MQTTLDIPEEQLSKLDQLSRDRQTTRDHLVQTAITNYIEGQTQALDRSFGVWSPAQDGLEYQQRLREEW